MLGCMLIQLLVERNYTYFLVVVSSLIIAISLHEFGHALAADVQGDHGPRQAGRLTLNPLRHLDPVGSLFLVLAGFGWGKPVQFSPRALRSRRAGAAIVAIAGPAMNVLLALLGAFLATKTTPGTVSYLFALEMVHINVLLAIFNLIPIPPLDGSRLLTIFLPPAKQQIIFFLDKWGFLLLLGVVFLLGGLLQETTGRAANAILAMFGQPPIVIFP